MSTDPLLKVNDLHVSFKLKSGDMPAVRGISYHIDKGETLGVVGESGCGKSVSSFSILRLISDPGYIKSGEILFKGTDLLKLKEKQMRDYRGSKIAIIFQEPMTALNPVLTVGKQLNEPLMRHQKLSLKQAKERSIEMLNLVGIPSPADRYKQYPHELSGGMRQRVMIAMALTCEPEFLIADEPTTALDVTIQGQIIDLLNELQDKFQMGIQFITHDLGVINEVSDRVMVMYAGRICELAKKDKLISSPRHPYTSGLLKSIPTLSAHQSRLQPIEGSVPSLQDLPPGCPFQNRCHKVKSECKEQMPELKEIETNHFVACFHPEDS